MPLKNPAQLQRLIKPRTLSTMKCRAHVTQCDHSAVRFYLTCISNVPVAVINWLIRFLVNLGKITILLLASVLPQDQNGLSKGIKPTFAESAWGGLPDSLDFGIFADGCPFTIQTRGNRMDAQAFFMKVICLLAALLAGSETLLGEFFVVRELAWSRLSRLRWQNQSLALRCAVVS